MNLGVNLQVKKVEKVIQVQAAGQAQEAKGKIYVRILRFLCSILFSCSLLVEKLSKNLIVIYTKKS